MAKDTYLIEIYNKLKGMSKANFNGYITNAQNVNDSFSKALTNVRDVVTKNDWNDDIENLVELNFEKVEKYINYCKNYSEAVVIPLSEQSEILESRLNAYVGDTNVETTTVETQKDTYFETAFGDIDAWLSDPFEFRKMVDNYYTPKDEYLSKGTYEIDKMIDDALYVGIQGHDANKSTEEIIQEVKEKIEPYFNRSQTTEAGKELKQEISKEDEIKQETLRKECYETIKEIGKLLKDDEKISLATAKISEIDSNIESIKAAIAATNVVNIADTSSNSSEVVEVVAAATEATVSVANNTASNTSTEINNNTGVATTSTSEFVDTSDEEAKDKVPTGTKIHFIGIGPGDAILIESNGHYGLVDSGNPYGDGTKQALSNSSYTVEHVKQYLTSQGVKTLDFVIATHSHSDHIGGMVVIANNFCNSNTKFYYRSYVSTSEDTQYPDWDNAGYHQRSVSAMQSRGVNLVEVTSKYPSFTMGDFTIQIFNTEPLTAQEAGGNGDGSVENANSICSLITYKGKYKTLLTGDMGKSDESKVYERAGGHVSIFKMPHHGCYANINGSHLRKLSPRKIIGTSNQIWSGMHALYYYMNKKYGSSFYLANGVDYVINFTDNGYYVTPDTPRNISVEKTQGSWKLLEGNNWVYEKNGIPVVGDWVQDDGYWYYLTDLGYMATGWVNDKGTWYYTNGSGAMVSNCTLNINGKNYSFDASGACTNPY